jgi:type 1 glutamine amidotransferase
MKPIIILAFTTLLWTGVASADAPATPVAGTAVVILTGANNHNWKSTTPVLERILEDSGRFTVDVVTEPELLTTGKLEGYAVLLSNWNGFGGKKPAPWSENLKTAYAGFVRGGGGHVVVHAGASSFYDWDAYQAMGIANWGKGTGHKSVHEFEVRITDKNHAITRGMDKFKTTDELWYRPFVHPNATVLAESFSRTTGNWEPTALVNTFGKGRCFTLLLGHDAKTMEEEGFQSLLLRGMTWAASAGDATQPK